MEYGGYGGHGRNDRHSRGGRFHKEDCESIRQTQKYREIKTLFDNGNFSKIRENIKKHYKEIECLYLELKNDQLKNNKFEEWNERDIIRNAAIISAYAVLRDLKTTQIRRIIEMTKSIHTRVKLKKDLEKIKDEIKKEALRMNMLMAYYAGKNKSVLSLQEVLEPVLNWLSGNPTPENFEKVYTFFEAIVAYHRYFGGKEK